MFSFKKFYESCYHVCPIICDNACSMGDITNELTLEHCLLNFIMYKKHDNEVTYESLCWNMLHCPLCDDALFIVLCINGSISHEISWHDVNERRPLGTLNPLFPSCIGLIDGTLVEIHHPWNNPVHSKWFNRRKKMHCLNDTVVVSNEKLFLHLDLGFLG